MSDLPAFVTLAMPDGTKGTYTLDSGPPPQPTNTMDFTADLAAFDPGHIIISQAEWNQIFANGIEQGISVYCLEQNTDATRHDFSLGSDSQIGPYLELFMPKGSYGMGHRSVNINIGKQANPINWSYKWMVPDPGCNLWTQGGGKWGGAIQYGPIQSGPTGGIRFMATWAAGASALGKQDLTCSIQNQPDGGQWLQPPYYGFRPIQYNHWYNIHWRMTGGSTNAPGTVRCEYWKDSDPVLDYTAKTTNTNAQAGKASIFYDITAFFGGGAANAAPRDCVFRFADLRFWVE